jgi:hypothetical protein
LAESFPKTRWSLVAELQRSDGMPNEAVKRFLELYASPLVGFLCQHYQLPGSKAEELFSDFLGEKVAIQRIIDQADARKGKLRSYLIRCLLSFAADELKQEKRFSGGEQASQAGRASSADDPMEQATRAWARHVIALALDAVELECQMAGHDKAWTILRARLLRRYLEGEEPEPYESLIARLELRGVSEAYNLLGNTKRIFKRELEGIVGQYAADAAEIDEEIRVLCETLCG